MRRTTHHHGWESKRLWKSCSRLTTQARPPRLIESWLLGNGSLTQALKAHFGQDLGLTLLRQGRQKPSLNESRLLSTRPGSWMLTRHIALNCGISPLVLARSLIPDSTLSGPLCRLAKLGVRPLGEFIFTFPSLERSKMEISLLKPGHPLFPELQTPAWGRRSLFRIHQKPLLVYEIFLPNLFNLLKQRFNHTQKHAA